MPQHRARISFEAAQPTGILRVRLTNGASLRVTQTSSDSDATFALTPDGVSVSNSGSTASYEIQIPIGVVEAHVHIAGTAGLFERPGRNCRATERSNQIIVA